MDRSPDRHLQMNRRQFLAYTGWGLGSVALASLLAEQGYAAPAEAENPLAPRQPHFTPKAKSVIYLGQIGAPSQFDLWDYRPELIRMDGKPIPDSVIKGQSFVFIGAGKTQVLASPWKWSQHGNNGTWLTDRLPYHREIVDDVAFIHTMQTNEMNHVPAQMLLQTGSPRMGRPAMGSWVTYGLGSLNRNLPGFVVLASGKAGRCGSSCWGSGFLPSHYQGVQMRSEGDPVLYLSNPPGIDPELRREALDTLKELNTEAQRRIRDPEIATRINAFEMAFRMQTSVPELMDLAREPAHIHRLYGTEPGKASFANNCLLARRLVERGVRFVQLVHGGWDHHGGRGDQNLLTDLPNRARQVDQGAAALVKDLKQRGLLDSTLVIFGGEFGRTPMLQGPRSGKELGRDHLRTAFTIWMAGGGARPGLHLGKTDDFGMKPVEDPVHVHDLQATILHLLGLDHKRLTFRFQGRDFRLTDVHGNVVKKVLA
jgi:Protein of unknown function (DUF1501)